MENLILFCKNTEDNKITLNSEINEFIINKYAPERHENSEYYNNKRGGRFTPFNAWYYKCAEFVAAQFMHIRFGLPLIDPDVRIYKSYQKNWNADLNFENVYLFDKHYDKLRIHVKSTSFQTIKAKYSESYTFQLCNKDGQGGRDMILDHGNENDFCIFVFAPYEKIKKGNVSFYIKALLPWNFIKDNGLLEDPQKSDHIGLKLVVYINSIKRKFQELNVLTF